MSSLGVADTRGDGSLRAPAVLAGLSRRTLLVGGLGATSMLAGCVPTRAVRYRLRLTVEAYGRTRDASVVQELAYRRASAEVASPGKTTVHTRGDGLVVDLGRDGVFVSTLVALASPGSTPTTPVWGPRPPTDRNWNGAALLAAAHYGDRRAWDLLEVSAGGPSVPIDPSDLPLLLHFPDRAAPLSVRKVDVSPPDPVVRIRAASLELTADALTRGVIDTALPWLPALRDNHLNLAGRPGSDGGLGLPFEVQAADLSRE